MTVGATTARRRRAVEPVTSGGIEPELAGGTAASVWRLLPGPADGAGGWVGPVVVVVMALVGVGLLERARHS